LNAQEQRVVEEFLAVAQRAYAGKGFQEFIQLIQETINVVCITSSPLGVQSVRDMQRLVAESVRVGLTSFEAGLSE
jgi:hypothetical protein